MRIIKFKTYPGFTLIELLVVIAIIGILSTVAMTSLNGARKKAKEAAARTDFNNFAKAVTAAQQNTGDYLMTITASGCSRCIGNCSNRDLRNIATTDACYTTWMSALSHIQSATGGSVSGLDVMARDPWGSPYLLDENEGERPANLCVRDGITSAGPDGIYPTADDFGVTLTYAKCD